MTIGSVSGYQPYNSLYTRPLTKASQAQEVNAVSGLEGEKKSANPDEVKKPGRKSSPEECETCKER